MVGAIITHISRGDVILSVITTSILFLVAVMIEVFRFKQYKSEE
jgi:predicted Na+-dependent transporter